MVYRIATMGEPKTLDPHGVSGTWENYIVGDAFMGLLTDAADAKPIPGAAESWTISDDGLTYTFKIRDHKWSDGVPVTADDFVYSVAGASSTRRLAAEYASLLYPIKNAEKINNGTITDPTQLGVRAIDAKTLEITLESPTGYFLELMTHYTSFPVPKHVDRQVRRRLGQARQLRQQRALTVSSSGRRTPQIVAVKNPDFYDAANVKIDKVIYYPDEDRNEVTKRFRAGEIDYADDFASEQIDFLKRELPKETHISPYLGTYYYPINVKRPPFDNPKVRRALTLAIDRDGHHGQGAEDRRAAGLRRGAAQDRHLRRSLCARMGQPAHSRARRRGQAAAAGGRLRPGQAAQARAVLQHQREPQAHRRRGAGDVEAASACRPSWSTARSRFTTTS